MEQQPYPELLEFKSEDSEALKRKYEDLICSEVFLNEEPSDIPVMKLYRTAPPIFKSVDIYWAFMEVFPEFSREGITSKTIPFLIGRLTDEATLNLYKEFPLECRKAIVDHFSIYFPDHEEHKDEFIYIIRCFRKKVSPNIGEFRCDLEVRAAIYALVNGLKRREVKTNHDLVVDVSEPANLQTLVSNRWTDLFISETCTISRYSSIAAHLRDYMLKHSPTDNEQITDAVLRLMATPQHLRLPHLMSPDSA